MMTFHHIMTFHHMTKARHMKVFRRGLSVAKLAEDFLSIILFILFLKTFRDHDFPSYDESPLYGCQI